MTRNGNDGRLFSSFIKRVSNTARIFYMRDIIATKSIRNANVWRRITRLPAEDAISPLLNFFAVLLRQAITYTYPVRVPCRGRRCLVCNTMSRTYPQFPSGSQVRQQTNSSCLEQENLALINDADTDDIWLCCASWNTWAGCASE